jgi:hypothetical protein
MQTATPENDPDCYFPSGIPHGPIITKRQNEDQSFLYRPDKGYYMQALVFGAGTVKPGGLVCLRTWGT